MQTVTIRMLIADAKTRLQMAKKRGLIMIKKPHAEKTVSHRNTAVCLQKNTSHHRVEDQ